MPCYFCLILDPLDDAQEVQQLKKKVQEQGEQLRSAERSMKEVQMQLMTKEQAGRTVQREFAQLKVHSHYIINTVAPLRPLAFLRPRYT